MADSSSKDTDELSGTEQPFVHHLKELRDRLVKATIAVALVCVVLSLYPGPALLYDFLAAPLVAQLPEGTRLIATSVISPFLVPLKIMLMTAFLIALPVVLYQGWAFIAPGLYMHEKKTGVAFGIFQHPAVFHWSGVLLLFCLWSGVQVHPKLCT